MIEENPEKIKNLRLMDSQQYTVLVEIINTYLKEIEM